MVRLVAVTYDSRFVDDLPQRLIGDYADDTDLLDETLRERAVPVSARSPLRSKPADLLRAARGEPSLAADKLAHLDTSGHSQVP